MAFRLGSYVFRNASWTPVCSRMKLPCRQLQIFSIWTSPRQLYSSLTDHCKALNHSCLTQPLLQKQIACVQHAYNQGQYRTLTENKKTTALTLIRDLKHLRSTPPAALVLGLGGVIPFAAMPAYMIASGTFVASFAFSQVAYGACILSFLGGIRWGLTIPEDSGVQPNWFNLGYSVTPSLIAWVGLLLPTSLSILTLITGLTGSAYMDLTMWGYPPWFRALRFLLSVLAILSLWTTLMCQIILSEKSNKAEKKEKDKSSPVIKVDKQDSKPGMISTVAKEVIADKPVAVEKEAEAVYKIEESKHDTDKPAVKDVADEEVKEIKD